METNEMQDAQPVDGTEATSTPVEKAPFTVPAVASGLAGLILERNLRMGRAIEIPSLGITIGGEAAREPASPGQAARK